ncbi:MAG TPA: hypothetical protein PLF75_07860 [Bacteroidales bacterium]|nr:hypothetical protein [Bacteroidales bacterium]
MERRGAGGDVLSYGYHKSHPYGVGRAKISGSYLLMLKKDEDDVALPYLMAFHIILTPA